MVTWLANASKVMIVINFKFGCHRKVLQASNWDVPTSHHYKLVKLPIFVEFYI